METIEQVNDNFEVKKSKKKGLVLVGIIVAVIVALALIYFLVFSNPKYIFGKVIDKFLKIETEEIDSIKFNSKIKATLETEDEDMKPVFDEISKCTLKFGTQLDSKEKKEIVNLGLEYNNDAVIDAQVYYDNGELYAYFDGLFEKYIEIDMDEEQKDKLKSIFERLETQKEQIKKSEKAIEILRTELKKQIKEEGTFEKGKETIEICDKEKKVKKYTLTLSLKELCTVASNMCTDLAKNKKFLECFDKDIKEDLENLAKELKENEGDSESNVSIYIYTEGLFNKFVGVSFEIYIEEENTTLQALVLKENKNSYTYKADRKNESTEMDVIDGTIKIKEENSKDEQKGKMMITMNMSEIVAKLEVEYLATYNKGVDKIDTSSSVKIEEITEEEVQEALEKLMKRPLIGEIISSMQQGLFDTSQESIEETKKMIEREEQLRDEIERYTYNLDYENEIDYDYDFDNLFTY